MADEGRVRIDCSKSNVKSKKRLHASTDGPKVSSRDGGHADAMLRLTFLFELK